VDWIDFVLIGLGALGCLYWLGVLSMVLKARANIPQLGAQQTAAPERWPRLSVIIPACDEADTIEAALNAQLASDYPELELILVDDRSSDGTGELIDQISASDERVKALHITELPSGWLGKVNAMRVGQQAASGDWLLFMDADVVLDTDALRRIVSWCLTGEIDYVTALPHMQEAGLLTDAAVSTSCRSVFIGGRMWLASDPDSERSAGFGAFLLVRREAFERSEGLEWLRMDVADDLAFGAMLKRVGARCAVVNARDSLRLNMYPDLGAVRASLEKGAYAIVGRLSPLRTLTAVTAMLLAEVAPLGLLATWDRGLPALLGGTYLLLGATTSIAADRWIGRSGRGGLLFPVGALLVCWYSLRSALLGWRNGGIRWRGTFYPVAALREGARVRWL